MVNNSKMTVHAACQCLQGCCQLLPNGPNSSISWILVRCRQLFKCVTDLQQLVKAAADISEVKAPISNGSNSQSCELDDDLDMQGPSATTAAT